MLLDLIRRKESGFSGMTFGIMDGVLAVLSILIGLGSVIDKYAIFSAMMIVGLADAMANAAGMRVSQETEVRTSKSQIFRSMLFAFMGTFSVVTLLAAPLVLLDMGAATIVSMILGMSLLCGLGVFVSLRRHYNREKMLRLIAEYVITGVFIIIVSHALGIVFQNPWVVLWLGK